MSFANATSWLKASHKTFSGETATLRHQHMETTVNVIRGSNMPRLNIRPDGSQYVELSGQEFLILPGEYVFDGIAKEPGLGDILEIGGQQYRVIHIDDTSGCWRWSDQHQTYYVVYTTLYIPSS